MPKEDEQIYVIEKDLPANLQYIMFNFQPLTEIDPSKATKFTGASMAKEINYAMIIPGTVLMQSVEYFKCAMDKDIFDYFQANYPDWFLQLNDRTLFIR